jgi:Spy/CpxP family protein refolding chaperone
MKYNFLGIAVILFSLAILTEAAAQPYGRGRGLGNEQGWRLSGLNLTQDQQDKITKLRTDHRNEVSKTRDDLDRLRIDKREMMRQNNINKNDYINLEKRMSSLREKIHLSGAEFRMQVYEILDTDQRQQLAQGTLGKGKKGKAGAQSKRGFCW